METMETKTMETTDIANRLVAYCRKGDWKRAHNELYAEDATSIEPYSTPDFEKETKGLNAIREKGDKFTAMVEKMHSLEISEPLVAGNSIAFVMKMDATMKEKGRMSYPELCVYQVKDGKIAKEEFFV
jgi:ketosteroid isomerase-like protein